MGNDSNIDLSKYSCSCLQKEEGCFLDFLSNITPKDEFNFITNSKKMTQSELEETTPGGVHYPNDNIVKSSLKKNLQKDLINIKNTESITSNISNNKNKTFDKNFNEKENDIKEFDKRTDYFQLVNQINNTIKELKSKIYLDKTQFNFKVLGKKANKIIFNDIIACIKKFSEINSEVILLKEKIYLGIVNKFKKESKENYLINYKDQEKIVSLPNYKDINDKYKEKLGDNNNDKFKFHKFSIKGSYPNEILIWNLITQNTQKIADILTEDYFCCIVLLYYSRVEEENESILYLINKPKDI